MAQAVSHRGCSRRSRTVPVTFVVDRAALRQASCLAVLPSTFVSRVSTLPPVFHTHPNMRVSISRRTSGRNLGTIPKATLFRNCRSCGWQTAFILPFTNGQVLLSYRFVSNCFVHSSYLLYLKVLPDLTFWGSCLVKPLSPRWIWIGTRGCPHGI